MKSIRAIVINLCFLLILSVAQADEAVYSLQVDGLGCPFCAYGIEKQLSAIEGVEQIKVDINKGQVFVTMQQDTILNKKQAQQAVSDAGFTLRSFQQSSTDNLNESNP